MKPIIGIVGRPHTTYTGREVICALDDYRRAVSNTGGIPIVILPTQDLSYEQTRPAEALNLTENEKEDLIQQIKLCDGLIFPGGNRIYDYDYFVCKYAMENSMNILGICMGMQLLACTDCMEDRHKVIDKISSKINHNNLESKYVHKINIEKNSKLYEIIGNEEIEVNSRHRFCVNRVKTFNIIAKSEDGYIEGIEKMDKSFIMGLQWHPESMEGYDESMKKLFETFIKVCKK